MATRALKHKIKNPVAVYFPLGKTNKPTDKQKKPRLIELSICASNMDCPLPYPCLSVSYAVWL